jgi:hypothetical protein
MSSPETRILDVTRKSANERLSRLRFDEQTSNLMMQQFRVPAHPGGYDRQPGCHGFENGVRKAFPERWKDKDVEGAKDRGHVVALSEKMHSWCETQGAAFSLKFGMAGPSPSNVELKARIRSQSRECPDQSDVVLDGI